MSTSPLIHNGLATRDNLIEVADLIKLFPISHGILGRQSGWVRAVDGVSLELRRGETLGLVGESGCGKSTLGRTIMHLLKPTSGTVTFRGTLVDSRRSQTVRALRRHAQMVFQDPYASVNPRMRVAEIVGEPLAIHGVGTPRERKAQVLEMLSVVGLGPDAATRYPHEFSGGQLQRIGIARALVMRPDLIVLDEPVSALDVSIQAQVVNLLQDLQDQFSLTYLMIAHDLGVVRQVATNVAVMYLGQIVETAPQQLLFERARHPYSVALLSAVPIPDPKRERARKRLILRGDLPSPANPPAGCRFATRCWLRDELGNPEICETIVPDLVQLAPSHEVRCHFSAQVDGRSVG